MTDWHCRSSPTPWRLQGHNMYLLTSLGSRLWFMWAALVVQVAQALPGMRPTSYWNYVPDWCSINRLGRLWERFDLAWLDTVSLLVACAFVNRISIVALSWLQRDGASQQVSVSFFLSTCCVQYSVYDDSR